MDGFPGGSRPAQDGGNGMRRSLLFLTAVLVAFPLTAARRERPKSADLSEPVAASPYRWEKMSEVDGLTVHWSRVQGTKVVAYRMEGILKATVGEVASLFHSQANPAEWLPVHTEDLGKMAEGPGETLWVGYWKPGPFCSRRAFGLRTAMVADPQRHGLILKAGADAGSSLSTKDLVQGDLTGSLQLTPMTFPDQTFLRAEFHCEMNGKMPAWVVNLIQQSWPRKAFEALKARIAKGGLKVMPEVEKLLATPPLPKPKAPRTRRHR